MSRVHELLDLMRETHDAKNQDYADSAVDPFRNFRMSERVGVPAWIGAFVRMGDKWNRIENLINKHQEGREPAVKRETITDTLLDLAVYSLLCICLYEEETRQQGRALVVTTTQPETTQPMEVTT